MLFPIADEGPKRFFPFINYIFLAINIAVFFFLLPGGDALNQFYWTFGLVPKRILEHPFYIFNYGTIFTSMFIHGGLFHLFGNMLYLWIAGDNIEYVLGHRRYFYFYLTVGVAAAIAQIVMEPGSSVPMVGASGAISGVLGAYLLKFPKNKISLTFLFLFYFRIPAVIVLIIWFLMQLSSGYLSLGPGEDGGVAYFAHIGGFVSGFILIKVFEKYRK